MCEVVMAGENLAKNLDCSKYDCYPGVEESEDEKDMDHSSDIHPDLEFGIYRSNTAARLKRMEEEQKRNANTMHIKWEPHAAALSEEDKDELFVAKDFRRKKDKREFQSLLTEQLKKYAYLPQNPFQDYAKFDGNGQIGVPTKKFGIFIAMLSPELRNYPMHVVVLTTAKISQLTGLICWKCSIDFPDVTLKESADNYGLFIADDDGEVNWDFPCLDPKEAVAKFGFRFLALVEVEPREQNSPTPPVEEPPIPEEQSQPQSKAQRQLEVDMMRMQGHMKALLFQSFKVHIINRVRSRTEVFLGVSGEKVEIYPVASQRGPFWWSKSRSATYSIDSVVACDLRENKSNNKAVFRLVYDNSGANSSDVSSSLHHQPVTWSCFKHHDFEAEYKVSEEIVQKINLILDSRNSQRRAEYLAIRERKSHRRKSFNFGPR
ncbi:unnamed protein product [Bemisia tabaci]|nr:unnamed protein product [Bemisia tabaci]